MILLVWRKPFEFHLDQPLLILEATRLISVNSSDFIVIRKIDNYIVILIAHSLKELSLFKETLF